MCVRVGGVGKDTAIVLDLREKNWKALLLSSPLLSPKSFPRTGARLRRPDGHIHNLCFHKSERRVRLWGCACPVITRAFISDRAAARFPC